VVGPDLDTVEAWDDFLREYPEDRETAKAMYRRGEGVKDWPAPRLGPDPLRAAARRRLEWRLRSG
jgi:hypothetical protein